MWRVAAACLLLVLAGCGGPAAAPATETRSVTAVEVPDDGTFAPGVTEEGVTGPSALARAHTDALAETSYRLVVNRTVRYANGTLRESLRVNLSLAADRGYLVHTATAGPAAPVFLGTPPANATFWSNGTTYLRRLGRDGTTTYNSFEPREGAGTWQYWARTVPFGGGTGNPRDFFEDTFETVETRLVGTENETAYLLVGETATEPLDEEYADPRNLSLRASVTPEGMVRSLTLRYEATVEGRTVTVVRTLRYEDVGETTAPRPPWYERAR